MILCFDVSILRMSKYLKLSWLMTRCYGHSSRTSCATEIHGGGVALRILGYLADQNLLSHARGFRLFELFGIFNFWQLNFWEYFGDAKETKIPPIFHRFFGKREKGRRAGYIFLWFFGRYRYPLHFTRSISFSYSVKCFVVVHCLLVYCADCALHKWLSKSR